MLRKNFILGYNKYSLPLYIINCLPHLSSLFLSFLLCLFHTFLRCNISIFFPSLIILFPFVTPSLPHSPLFFFVILRVRVLPSHSPYLCLLYSPLALLPYFHTRFLFPLGAAAVSRFPLEESTTLWLKTKRDRR